MRILSYKGNIDGCYPYIFKKRENRKILYIKIISLKYLKEILSIKNENNGNIRVFNGILDVNRFLTTNKQSNFCSYVDDWKLVDFVIFRSKEVLFVFILLIINIILFVIEKIPMLIKDNKYYIWVNQITASLFHDILSRIIN